jgi:hypothetical protein
MADGSRKPPFEWALRLVCLLVIPEATVIVYYASSLLQADNERGGRTSVLNSAENERCLSIHSKGQQ